MADKFSFFISYLEQISKIPEEYQLDAYRAICEYALLGKEPSFEGNAYADIVFTGARPVIDAGRRKAEAGRKGGEANGKQTESKPKAKRKRTIKKEETETKQPASDKDKDKEKDKDKDIYNIPHPSDADYEAEFNTLWDMYPKKAGNKQRALSAYRKARKDGTDYATVLLGINNYKGYIKARQLEDKYILYASTYFCGHRWNDDYSHTPKNSFNIEAHDYDFDELEKELLA